jgi:hypothetical protein
LMSACARSTPATGAATVEAAWRGALRLAVAAAMLLPVTVPDRAAAQDYWDNGGPIPDATTPGTNGFNPNSGIFTSTITLSNEPPITSVNSITIDSLQHPYAGDLFFELTHDDTGTSVIFMNRALKTSLTSDGMGVMDFGSYTEASGNFTFVTDLASTESGSDSLWNALSMTSDLLGGVYAATSNDFTGSDGTSYTPTDLNVFAGESGDGTWTLTAMDESHLDTGSFSGWDVDFTFDPAPEHSVTAMALVGGAVFLFVQRLRRPAA